MKDERDRRAAVYLPEVAHEVGWSREQTLIRLVLKVGLEGDAWRNGACLRVFDSRKYAATLEDATADLGR